MSTVVAGAGLLAVLSTTPAAAGGTPAMVTPGGGCTATVAVDSEWGSGTTGGQVLRFTVTNTSAAQSTAWTVTWTLGAGQRISSQWNAAITTSGSTVTAKNEAYNGKLAAGASTGFGVMVAGVAAAPTVTCDNGTGTPAADVTVGQSDNGRRVSLQVGQTLAVSLGSDYATPAVSGEGLSTLSSSGGYPTGTPFTAVYRAAAAGTVAMTARSGTGTAVWTVYVTIVGPSSTGSGQSYSVTQADNNRTLNLTVGDIVVVNLDHTYQPPTVTPAGVLTLGSVSGGYPTGQPLVARYLVSGTGTADIKTRTDADCMHQPTPCPSPSIPWTLHVSVGGPSSSTGQTYTVTQSSNGSTRNLWVGDVVVVSLPANYQPPTVTPAGVLTLSSISGGYPTGQPLVARYLVSGAGSAQIKTRTDIACFHEPTPCPSPSIPWTLYVVAK